MNFCVVVRVFFIVIAVLATTACTNSNAGETERADATAAQPAAEPTSTPTPAPTSTPVPTATPIPTPTPHPLLVEAEAIALEHSELTAELFDDPLNMDLSRMIALEAGPEPRQPMTDWALRAVANLVEQNRYQPSDDVRFEVTGSQWDPDHVGQLAWVDICTQTGPAWYDLDTNEPVLEVGTDPFVRRLRILTDTMQIAALAERFGDVVMSCEFSEDDE